MLHGENVKDPLQCPFNSHIRCIKDSGNAYIPIMKNQRNCERCGWGPNAEAIKKRRLAKVRKELEHERASKLQRRAGRD